MQDLVVFCRRWIDWRACTLDACTTAEAAAFPRDYQIERLQAAWKCDNPAVPLGHYRQELQALARNSWDASGAQVVLHHCLADAPHLSEPDVELIQRLRAARWVIPIDDDDWIAPHLPGQLQQPRGQRVWMATWHSWLIYLHTHHIQSPPPITVLPETMRNGVPVIVSSSAALSNRLIQCLSDRELWLLLMQHGELSRFFAELPHGLTLRLDEGLAVHLRHQCTAGSGKQGNLNRRLGNFLQQGDHSALPAWIRAGLTQLATTHAEM